MTRRARNYDLPNRDGRIIAVVRAHVPCLIVPAFALSLGCSGESAEPPPDAPTGSCAPGEWPSEDGSCVPAGLPPDMPCPPGEWPRQDGSCVPAGVPPEGCGEGFVHDGDRGCAALLPAEPCPVGFMAVPGEMRCHDVAPCAPGTWGDIPVEPDSEYVDTSYAGMDSDGSALRPWTSIQAAVDAAAPGALVAIAAGSYHEDVIVSGKPVRLWGVCPALVEVVGTGAVPAAVGVLTLASGSAVRGIAVRGAAVGVRVLGSLDVLLERIWAHDNARQGVYEQNDGGPTSVTLRGALIEHNHEQGVFVAGAEVTLETCVVRTTEPDAGGLFGRGLNVQARASNGAPSTLQLRRSVVEQNHDVGVYVGGSPATLEAVVVRATQLNAQGLAGRGVNVQPDPMTGAPASLQLGRSLVDQNHDVGVFIQGSEATLEATVVRATQPNAQGLRGMGMEVVAHPTGARSTLWLERSLVEQNHDHGVLTAGSDATIEATVVRATELDGQGLLGRGVSVQFDGETRAPASLLLQHSLIEQNHEVGVLAAGAEAALDSSVIRATQPNGQGLLGRGVNLQTHPAADVSATFLLRRSLVEQNHDIGVFVEASDATLESSVVRATQPTAEGRFGYGVTARAEPTTAAPTTLLLQRSVVEQSHEFGVLVSSSVATIVSCLVRDTLANVENRFGHSLAVVSDPDPASATISATRIDRSALAAVAVFGAQAAIGGSSFSCQAFDLDAEPYLERAPTLSDLGNNLCGCPEPNEPCKRVSANLEPPPPVEPPPAP